MNDAASWHLLARSSAFSGVFLALIPLNIKSTGVGAIFYLSSFYHSPCCLILNEEGQKVKGIQGISNPESMEVSGQLAELQGCR